MKTHNHHIDDRSLNSPITPTLGVNYTLVECSSIGNDAPLRVFYLFLLQNKYPGFLEQFEDIIKEL